VTILAAVLRFLAAPPARAAQAAPRHADLGLTSYRLTDSDLWRGGLGRPYASRAIASSTEPTGMIPRADAPTFGWTMRPGASSTSLGGETFTSSRVRSTSGLRLADARPGQRIGDSAPVRQVPEPPPMGLLALGLLALVGVAARGVREAERTDRW
jgi:hypothetical protein